MPISVSCPCGKKLKAPDELAGRVAKCPKCGANLDIPVEFAVPVLEAEPDPEPQAATAADSRPDGWFVRWMKDPVVFGGTLVAALIAVGGGIFVSNHNIRMGKIDEVQRLHEQGHQLIREGKILEANVTLEQAIRLASPDGLGDEGTRQTLDSDRETVARIMPQVEAERAKLIEERRAAELAALREDQGRREAAEAEARSKLKWDVEGQVVLELKNGKAITLPDLSVRILKPKIPIGDLDDEDTAALLSTEAFAGKTARDNVNLLLVFLACRHEMISNTAFTDFQKIRRFTDDPKWPPIAGEATVARAVTDSSGRFRIPGVPDGKYLAYAKYRSEADYIEWCTPIEVHAETKIELNNEKAAIILDGR